MIDLVRRLIEALRNYLSPPRRPPPVAWLSPPLQPNSIVDDRFGYGQEVQYEGDGPSQRERQKDRSSVRPEENPPAPDPQAEPAAGVAPCGFSDAHRPSITTEPSTRTPYITPFPSTPGTPNPAASSEPSAEQPPPSGAPKTETASPAAAASPSRKARRKVASEFRKLEKARMKFDKWVTPKGEPAEKAQRAAPKPKAPTGEAVELEGELDAEIEDPAKLANVYIREHYDMDPDQPEVAYEETECWGLYNFRDTILDQLERYWWYLERMKARDPDAYGFYKTYGAQLVPYLTNKLMGKTKGRSDKLFGEELEKYRSEICLPPMFNATRPTFGCVVFGANPKVESWESGKDNRLMWPRFIYYTKMARPPPETQLMLGGDTYKCTLWWDSPKCAKKWGTPQQFCIFIDPTGQHIQVLRTCETKFIQIHRKKGLGLFDIPDRHWRIPDDFEEWAHEFGIDAQTHLSHTFCTAVEHAEFAHFGDVRVAVHKDDMTALFGIDSRRLSYFFRDRDYDESGHRGRVFHIVKPHVRADGTAVKMHYRGEKSFDWAGYRVEITVPALDHFMDEDFGVGSSDAFWIPHHKKKYLTEPEVAAKLVGWQHQGYGGHQRS